MKVFNRYWYYIIWLSFKWIFRVNLGDMVWYQGEKYMVHQGTRPYSWRLNDLPYPTEHCWVPRSECKKVLTPVNIFRGFFQGYKFYMTSWYDIWKLKGIEPWMRPNVIDRDKEVNK